MKTTLSTFPLVLVALGGLAASAAIAADQESIQGAWKIQGVSLGGKAMPAPAAIYVFSGATLTIRTEGRADQKAIFRLETDSRPKMMVVLHGDSSSAIKPDRTPYELKGDILKIAFSSPDETSLEVSDKGQMLMTLERQKP